MVCRQAKQRKHQVLENATKGFAHVEGSGGVNTIWLDPHGAGGDRSLDLIHETFHIDPPGFSDIDIAHTFMKTAKFASEASASSWWSHHVDDNCGGQKKQ